MLTKEPDDIARVSKSQFDEGEFAAFLTASVAPKLGTYFIEPARGCLFSVPNAQPNPVLADSFYFHPHSAKNLVPRNLINGVEIRTRQCPPHHIPPSKELLSLPRNCIRVPTQIIAPSRSNRAICKERSTHKAFGWSKT